MTAGAPLIKGYLPVRLRLPPPISGVWDGDKGTCAKINETIFYVKEHQHRSDGDEPEEKSTAKRTLFVANAPVVPFVRTRLLLKSLFGRYAEVSRVTVVPNPRRKSAEEEDDEEVLQNWTTKFTNPSYLKPAGTTTEGKFAHVVFSNAKNMKRALKALGDLMSGKVQSNDDVDDSDTPALNLDRIEIQTLADETDRQVREEQGLENEGDDNYHMDESSSDEDDKPKKKRQEQPQLTGILAVADRFRASCNRLSRDALLEECNLVMQRYEDAEEAERIRKAEAANQPDEEGFITVSYSSQVGSKRDLEESRDGDGKRRRGKKRSRSKKKGIGASELTDFYRFQAKETRKKTLQDLRQKFEEDLEKVKKMKEEKQYRPF